MKDQLYIIGLGVAGVIILVLFILILFKKKSGPESFLLNDPRVAQVVSRYCSGSPGDKLYDTAMGVATYLSNNDITIFNDFDPPEYSDLGNVLVYTCGSEKVREGMRNMYPRACVKADEIIQYAGY